MPAKKIFIWGAGGHARIVTDIITVSGQYEIIGYLDDLTAARKGEAFLDAIVLGGEEELGNIASAGVASFLVAVGDNHARTLLVEKCRNAGFAPVTAHHPSAIISSSARIGPGSVICAGTVVGPAAMIGQNTIINTSATIDHDCHVGDAAHISVGVHIGGHVNIGKASFLGIGSIIKDHVCIGKNVLIGAGSVVLTDIPDNCIAYGVPAKPEQRHSENCE